jgi:Uma2 family endonuclease
MNFIESSLYTELLLTLSDQFDGRVLGFVGWEAGDNLFCPDLLVYEEGALRRREASDDGWFTQQPIFVVELVTRRRRWQGRQQAVNAYLAHGAGAVVEVIAADEILLIHHPENTSPLVVRSRIEWPFVLDLDKLFEDVRARHLKSTEV